MSEQDGLADVGAVIGRWQQSLLDLSRRNRLLFFKPGKTFVRLLDREPDTLIEALSSRRGLRFDYAERKTPEEDESEIRFVRGDLSADCAPLDLQRRLKGLQKRDIEWDQEQGIKILYLALGFVMWIDEDGYEGRAPLLLLPATLHRASPKDPFVLHRESDEPDTNPTLAYRFTQLGMELPGLGEGSASEYLENVKNLVVGREGWSVDSDIFLSSFAYNKLAMWQDLETLRQDGVSHPLVLEMAAQGQQERPPATETSDTPSLFPSDEQLTGGKLDDLLELRDQVTVINADFSQLKAIESSRQGQNLVVHGPPGTGKSQTITNIISALIADGKKVLFVSEKRAALDVVKRNLENCNLGVFCLDMHSKHGRKSAVYKQIDEALSADSSTRPMKAGRLDELAGLREKLNGFVRALHEPRHPLGRSIFDMSGVYAATQHLPSVTCDGLSWIPKLDEAKYAAIDQIASSIVQRRKEFSNHETSPWRPLKATTFHLGLSDEIRRDLVEAQREICRLRDTSRSVAESLGLQEPGTANEVAGLRRLCEHLSLAPGILQSWLKPRRADDCLSQAGLASIQCKEREQLENETEVAFGDRNSWPDFEDLHARLALLNQPRTADAMAVLLGDGWKEEISVDTENKIRILKELTSALNDLRHDLNDACTLMGPFPSTNWADVRSLCNMVETIVKLCPVSEVWLTDGQRVVDEFQKFRVLATEITKREQRLAEVFDDSFISDIDLALAIRYRTNYQIFLRGVRPQYWRDRRFIHGHMNRPRKMSVNDTLRSIDEALKAKGDRTKWLNSEATARDLLGGRFGGINSDWNRIEAAIQETTNLVSSWPKELSALTELLTIPERAHPLRAILRRLQQNRQRIVDLLASLGRPCPIEDSAESLVEASVTATRALKEILAALKALKSGGRSVQVDLDPLLSRLATATQLLQVERDFGTKSSRLSALLGPSFRGYETDWQDVEQRLAWTKGLLGLVPGHIPSALAENCERPKPATVYKEMAASLTSNFSIPISEQFAEERSEWNGWSSAPFTELDGWTEYLIAHSDEVADWIDYRTACARIDELFGSETVARIRAKTDDASLIPGMVLSN